MTDVDHPNDAPEQTGANPDAPTDRLLDEVARKQARKLRSRAVGKPDLLRGFGASGMVGWSITIPTLIGIALGMSLYPVVLLDADPDGYRPGGRFPHRLVLGDEGVTG